MNKTGKRAALAALLAAALPVLTGCVVQPDPSLEPLTLNDASVPFGTVSSLPTAEPTPSPQAAEATPDPWRENRQEDWEDWSAGTLPTTTPRRAATAAPGQESWETSPKDYNAGYPVLRLGSTGDDVADLQRQLALLRYYDGEADGRYSTAVQEAVRAFQERNGLTADGIAGRETQDLLYSSQAQAKLISAEAPDETYLLLKQGSIGIEVRRLQARLLEMGFYSGGVDGLYGQTTVDAVRAFQRANGLSADGQAGQKTQERLYSSAAKASDSPVALGDPDENRVLSVGMTGNDVYALQERLIALRYLNGVADGVFGAETRDALVAYQKNNGLTADGTTNAATWRRLNGSSRASGATPSPAPRAQATMHEGDSGENVYLLQARLFELGYYDGRIDGRYGAETTDAVRAFQRANGLAADGVAGKGTQKQLASPRAVAAGAAPAPEAADEIPAADTLPTMRRGDKGESVTALQERLVGLGYLAAADGQFGGGTDRAVKLFQEANGLTADGVAGPGTLAILFGNDAVAYGDYFRRGRAAAEPASEPAPAPTAAPRTDVVLQWQSEGEDVLRYQQRLQELGYLAKKGVTGTFNQLTVDATKAFQRMSGLKVDGAAGPDTLKLVYSKDALNANGDVPGD